MKYPPHYFEPQNFGIFNGDPAHSDHAQALDRFTCWMVAGRRQNIPAMITKPIAHNVTTTGDPVLESHTFEPVKIPILCPSYTTHLGCSLLASGSGDVTFDCPDDANNAVLSCHGHVHTTHEFEQAEQYSLGMPVVGAVGDGVNRAFKITKQDTPRLVIISITVANDPSLKVHAIKFHPLFHHNSEGVL